MKEMTVNMSDIVPRFAPFTVQCHCFSPSFLLIKLVHNCYLNSIFFFSALLKALETNEKGTENMSDIPTFAPFTMQFKKVIPPPVMSRALRALGFASLRSAMDFQVFLKKPVGKTATS